MEKRELKIVIASSLILFSGAACAQTAQERADEYLQQTIIDPMNAQRTLNGMPVITLDEYKADLAANRKRAADAYQAAIDEQAAKNKANPLVQEVNRMSGPCGGWKDINRTQVPVQGKCVAAYATMGTNPKTGRPECDALHIMAKLPTQYDWDRHVWEPGEVCLTIGDNLIKTEKGYEVKKGH